MAENQIMDNRHLQHMMKLRIICDLLVQGSSRASIVKKLSEEWGLKRQSVSHMVTEALLMLEEENPTDKKQIKTLSMARLEDLYEKSGKVSDRIKVIDITAKLSGLYEQNINIGNKDEETIKFDIGV